MRLGDASSNPVHYWLLLVCVLKKNFFFVLFLVLYVCVCIIAVSGETKITAYFNLFNQKSLSFHIFIPS